MSNKIQYVERVIWICCKSLKGFSIIQFHLAQHVCWCKAITQSKPQLNVLRISGYKQLKNWHTKINSCTNDMSYYHSKIAGIKLNCQVAELKPILYRVSYGITSKAYQSNYQFLNDLLYYS